MKKAAAVFAFKKFGLTRRESDVLLWIARGKSNAEIGASLLISPLTVKKHLEHVFDKLGVRTRLAAAVRAGAAYSAGLPKPTREPVSKAQRNQILSR